MLNFFALGRPRYLAVSVDFYGWIYRHAKDHGGHRLDKCAILWFLTGTRSQT